VAIITVCSSDDTNCWRRREIVRQINGMQLHSFTPHVYRLAKGKLGNLFSGVYCTAQTAASQDVYMLHPRMRSEIAAGASSVRVFVPVPSGYFVETFSPGVPAGYASGLVLGPPE
jgi:hypothetical protein